MSPTAEAKAELARLWAETGEDSQAVRKHLGELASLYARPDAWQPDRPELAVAALALHHYYTAIEAALERVARVFEGKLPTGRDWHRELLHGSALELPGVRPAVLRRTTESTLHELLQFRHVLRRGYAIALDPSRLRSLAEATVGAGPDVEADLQGFRDYLARCAAELDAET